MSKPGSEKYSVQKPIIDYVQEPSAEYVSQGGTEGFSQAGLAIRGTRRRSANERWQIGHGFS